MKLYRSRQVTVEVSDDEDFLADEQFVRLPNGELVLFEDDVFQSLFEPLL